MQLPHHVQQKVDDYLTEEVTEMTDVAVLWFRKLLRINIWLAQTIYFLPRQCNLDIDFVEFTLETFSLLHYLLKPLLWVFWLKHWDMETPREEAAAAKPTAGQIL